MFAALGLRPSDMLIDEEQMKRVMFLAGTRTPEGVFSWSVRGPLIQRFGAGARLRVTVEVKRIAFLRLPEYLPESYRRRYSQFEYWFQEMVQHAVSEITPHLARRFGVQAHIVGLAVPVSMSAADRRELRAAVKRHIDTSRCPVPVDFWVVPEPKIMFGRLLTPSAFSRVRRRNINAKCESQRRE